MAEDKYPWVYHVAYEYQTHGGMGMGDMVAKLARKADEGVGIATIRQIVWDNLPGKDQVVRQGAHAIIIRGLCLIGQPKLVLPGQRKPLPRSTTRRLKLQAYKHGKTVGK